VVDSRSRSSGEKTGHNLAPKWEVRAKQKPGREHKTRLKKETEKKARVLHARSGEHRRSQLSAERGESAPHARIEKGKGIKLILRGQKSQKREKK